MANRIEKYPIPTECIYCKSEVIFTSNVDVYGKKYGNGKCYKCTNCDAYVGVHSGTNIPLGRLANKELRALKKSAHALFDPQWKEGKKKRGQAYEDLAKHLGIPKRECHFGWFDKETLEKAISILAKEMMKETVGFLRKDSDLTDEWGRNFIKSLIKISRENKKLTDKQITYLQKQYQIVKKNANQKGIAI